MGTVRCIAAAITTALLAASLLCGASPAGARSPSIRTDDFAGYAEGVFGVPIAGFLVQVPSLACSSSTASGVDLEAALSGTAGTTLKTDLDFTCRGGVPSYGAQVTLLTGTTDMTTPLTGLDIRPGDTVSVGVSDRDLELDSEGVVYDATTGQEADATFPLFIAASGRVGVAAQMNAEGKPTAEADFGSVTFTMAGVNNVYFGELNAEQKVLWKKKVLLGNVGANYGTFTDTWLRS